MKHTLLALASLIASYCASASPAATQNWVKDYVATNSTGGGGGGSSISTLLSPTTVTVYDDNGSPATVTFNWCQNTNLALRVYDSNVSGMTNGLTFAKTADMRYYNATNYACQYITGNVEIVRMIFTSAVDRVVGNVTNTVYTGTNYIYGVVYYAHVNGTCFRSFQTASNIYAFQPDTTNADSRIFYAIETYVSDITRNKIVTDPSFADVKKRKFSFWELFFPSAYAGYGDEMGPYDVYTDPEIVEPGVPYVYYGYYYSFYYTDDEQTYSLGTVNWTLKNGESATYEIDIEMPFRIPGGTYIEDVESEDTSQYDTDWLWSYLEDKLPRGRYQQLSRSESAKEAINNKLLELKKQYDDDIKDILSHENPKKRGPVEIGSGVGTCGNNHLWGGHCGAWECKRCGEKDDEPSTHTYNVSSDECDICKNKHTGNGADATCNFRPDEIEHHRGWRDGDYNEGHKCRCSCAKYKLTHKDPNKADSYFSIGDYICYRNWTCARCGDSVYPNTLPSEEPGNTVSATSHAFNGNGSWSQFETNGVNMCKGDYVCDHSGDPGDFRASGCGKNIVEYLDHVPSNDVTAVEIANDDDDHENIALCVRNCGYRFVSTNSHEYGQVVDPGKVGDPVKPPTSEKHFKYQFCGNCADGTFDGKTTCGHVYVIKESDHQWITNYEYATELKHEVYTHCPICRYEKTVGMESHVPQSLIKTYSNDVVHVIRSTCKKCLEEYTVGTEVHIPLLTTMLVNNVGDDGHEVTFLCSASEGCGQRFILSTNAHTSGTVSSEYFTDTDLCSHYQKFNCSMKDFGCTYVGGKTNSAHCVKVSGVSKFYAVNDVTKKDYWTCGLCPNGISVEMSHRWYCDPNEHYCINENSNHLRGEHTFVNNVCSVCGYSKSTTENEIETMSVFESLSYHPDSVGGGMCGYAEYPYWRYVSTNGVWIAPKDRGEWNRPDSYTYMEPCYWLRDGLCNCSYCNGTSSSATECYCERIRRGDVAKLITAKITDSYFRRWSMAHQSAVDFSDPVYEIGNSCFEEAFISMPNLLTVYAPSVTNIGDNAFLHAFTNSVKLENVNFEGLTYAGVGAFREAFVGCSMGDGLSIGSLEECGSGCFSGAFKDTFLTGISFDSLVNANNDLDLFDNVPCRSFKELSAPKLNYNMAGIEPRVFRFSDMPNLTKLNLSGASSNIVAHIGDLSSLSKLTRIDFHEMSEIPTYWQDGVNAGVHAPTNNPNCMIVVPNDLWERWCATPGWVDIENQIVPYSNQVIRPSTWVTVSFDTDWGTTVADARIRYGRTATLPTDVHKFASFDSETDDGSFTLEGWYTNSSRTVKYENWPIVTNCTLYAKWNDNRRYGGYSINGYCTQGGAFEFNDAYSSTDKYGFSCTGNYFARFISNAATGTYFTVFIDDMTTYGGGKVLTGMSGNFSQYGIDVGTQGYPSKIEISIPNPDGTTNTFVNTMALIID